MATEPPRTLAEHFGDAPVADHGRRWNACWEAGTTPWDRGGPSLALADLLEQRAELFPFPEPAEAEAGAEGGPPPPPPRRRRTALVAGCGRGHDVLLLASFGFDVVGLDISDRAAAEARRNAAAVAARDHAAYPPRGPAAARFGRGRVAFLVGDFFADDFVREAGVPGGRFDLLFDYTFGCALPPSAKPAWARRYKDLLAPGGRLVCLEFPSTKRPDQAGPPWAMPPHTYLAYLGHPGEEAATDAHGGVLKDRVRPPAAAGLHRLLHLKPARTHQGGMEDGKVLDWISVWTHCSEDV